MNALIGMRLWLSPSPLGIRPAWAAVAGMLAAGITLAEQTTIIDLFLVIFLVDALWGALVSRLTAAEIPIAQRDPKSQGYRPQVVLPWMRQGSPADRALRWMDGPLARDWRDGIVALAGALLLAAILGDWAVQLTLLVGLLASLIRGLPTTSLPYRMGGSVVAVVLPMVAGAQAAGGWDRDILSVALAVALLATFAYPSAWRVGVLLAQGALVGLLVILREPLAAAGVTLLLLPTTLWTISANTWVEDADRWKALTGPWWLATMWLASWALY